MRTRIVVFQRVLAFFLFFALSVLSSSVSAGSDDIPEEESTRKDMVLVPRTTFRMGSSENEGNASEHPSHPVTLDAYWIDACEVTNSKFAQFVEATGYVTDAERKGKGWVWDDDWKEMAGADWRHPKGPGSTIEDIMNHPVVQVSWNDAVAYCEWAGKRLPTEAEWECACRAGTESAYAFGSSIAHDQANYSGTGGLDRWEGTSPVASFQPNNYGVFDMHGNVWEWCLDTYDEDFYKRSPTHNPVNEDAGKYRVMRGGAWDYCPLGMRSAYRGADLPTSASDARGFRCVKPCTDKAAGQPKE